MPLEQYPKGRKAALYYNSTLLFADLVDATIIGWLQDANTKLGADVYDVAEGTTPEYADITTRKIAEFGYTGRKPVIKEGEVTFDVIWNTNDANDAFVQALIDAITHQRQSAESGQGRPVPA